MILESLRAETEAKANLATALLAQSLDERRAMAAELARLSGEVERRQQAIAALEAGLSHTHAELADARAGLAAALAETERLGAHIHALVNSTSWKLTAPLRWAMRRISRR